MLGPAIDVVDGVGRAKNHRALRIGQGRIADAAAQGGYTALPEAHLAGTHRYIVDLVIHIAGALGKLLVNPAAVPPGVHARQIRLEGVGIAAELDFVMLGVIPEPGAAPAEGADQITVLIKTGIVHAGHIAIGDALLLQCPFEDFKHPFPVADVDGVGVSAGEDDVIHPAVAVDVFLQRSGFDGVAVLVQRVVAGKRLACLGIGAGLAVRHGIKQHIRLHAIAHNPIPAVAPASEQIVSG